MRTAKLTVITSNHDRVRTKVTTGTSPAPPVVGKSFHLYAESLDPNGDLRLITTSPVTELTETGFRTANSEYGLEYVEGPNDAA